MPDTTVHCGCTISTGRNNLRQLWLDTEQGKRQVHSSYNPAREASRLVASMRLHEGDLVVVVGGGLGYLQQELERQNIQLQLIIVEPDREVARRLGVQSATAEQQETIVDSECEQVIKRITRRQMQNEFCDVILYINPAYAAAFTPFVRQLTRSFQPGRNSSRFQKGVHTGSSVAIRKVLLLDTGYFLQQELTCGLSELGLEQTTVKVSHRNFRIAPGGKEGRYEAEPDFLPRLLESVAAFKPDLLLTVNHLGFDKEGRLSALLEELQLPVAVWYVDSPTYILNGQLRGVNSSHHLFVWERSYLDELATAGFTNVSHLPLAAGHHMTPGRQSRLERGAFVGGSNSTGINLWSEKPSLRLNREQEEKLIAAQRLRPSVNIGQHLLEAGLTCESELLRRNSESLMVLKATQRERVELLQKLPVDVFGDQQWSELLSHKRHIGPRIDYYRELPAFYQRYAVQLNQTSFQMNTTVNQRVFDVPLCGGLLLTDYRQDLERLFDIDRECVVYHDHTEASDKLKWYLGHEAEAASISEAAAARIKAEHLYQHRLRTMMNILNSRLREEE
jgi:spore maturation protein CgeB